MAHQVAGEQLPVRIDENKAYGAQFITTLLGKYEKGLDALCGQAWSEIGGPDSCIVKSTFARDPEPGDWKVTDLPALYLWSDKHPSSNRETDAGETLDIELNMLWVPPTSTPQIMSARAPFWNSISRAIALITTGKVSVDTSSAKWGRRLVNEAGLYRLELLGGQTAPLTIGNGQSDIKMLGYMWRLLATEDVVADNVTGTPAKPGRTCTNYYGGTEGNSLVLTSDISAPD